MANEPEVTAEVAVGSHIEKDYRCTRCGHVMKIKTNHYKGCWSFGHVNCCPQCPPWAKYPEHGGQTVWECLERPPGEQKKCSHCSFFEKEDRPHETFVFLWGALVWDIDKAKEIVAGREPQQDDIAKVSEVVDYPVFRDADGKEKWRIDRIHVLEEHLDHVDPNEPIIIGWMPSWGESKGAIVLDGHHRIARNIRDKTGRIFIHVLSQEESDSICTDNRPRPRTKRKSDAGRRKSAKRN
jgi:hypothetical protein